MAVDLICPDCGGVIGGKGVDAEGRGPCTCFAGTLPDRQERQDSSSDTVSIPTAQAAAESAEREDKFCVVCGKNVAGHRRIKDSRGYLCYDCAKAERRSEIEGTIPCAECGRRIKEAGLLDYHGIRICRKCYEDHKESQKKATKKVPTKHYDAHERKTLIILGIIFAVLGLIVLWQQFLR